MPPAKKPHRSRLLHLQLKDLNKELERKRAHRKWLASQRKPSAYALRKNSASRTWRVIEDAMILAKFTAGFSCSYIALEMSALKLNAARVRDRLSAVANTPHLLDRTHRYITAHPLIGLRTGKGIRSAPTAYWNPLHEQIVAETLADSDNIDTAVGRLMRRLGRTEAIVRHHLVTHHQIDTERARRRPEYRGPWDLHADSKLLMHGYAGKRGMSTLSHRGHPHDEVSVRLSLLRRDRRRLNTLRGYLGAIPPGLADETDWRELDLTATGAPSANVYPSTASAPDSRSFTPANMRRGLPFLAVLTGMHPQALAYWFINSLQAPIPWPKAGIDRHGESWTAEEDAALIGTFGRISLTFIGELLGRSTFACICRLKELQGRTFDPAIERWPRDPSRWRD